MEMHSTYWLEKVLKMISLYVNALLCTLQRIVIQAMRELTPLSCTDIQGDHFAAPSLTSKYFAFAFV